MRSRNQRSWLTTWRRLRIREGFFEGAQGFDVEVVGGFVEQQHVGAFGEGLGQVDRRLRSPPERMPTFFCWSEPLKLKRPM
jgi:hypothetical protein